LLVVLMFFFKDDILRWIKENLPEYGPGKDEDFYVEGDEEGRSRVCPVEIAEIKTAEYSKGSVIKQAYIFIDGKNTDLYLATSGIRGPYELVRYAKSGPDPPVADITSGDIKVRGSAIKKYPQIKDSLEAIDGTFYAKTATGWAICSAE